MRTLTVTVCLLAAPILAAQDKSFSGKSETCREAVGKTQKDLSNALAFCKNSIPKDLAVQGAIAMESLLWIKVNRALADALRADRLTTEQIMKRWMNQWKTLSGSKAVTVYVEWGDVEIAKGDTSIFSGDKVTIK